MVEIPETMKRLVLVKKGKEVTDAEIRVETVPVPKPKSGEILVRMSAAPVNPSDYMSWKLAEGEEPGEPEEIGKEGSGVVVANGGGLLGWRLVGKGVAVTGVRGGTYQEYVCAPAHLALVTDSNTPVEDSCSAFVNPFTVVGIAETAKEYGSPTFIHTAAASVLGQMMVRVSAELGIKVVNVVRREAQVELLKGLGAEYIVNTSDDNWKQVLSKYIEDLNITVAFDAIGGSMTGTLVSMLPKKSHVFNYGVLSSEPIANVQPLDLIYRGKQLHGWFLPHWLRNGSFLSVALRFRRASNMVMPNLAPGKWASSVFKDCTMESMTSEFAQVVKTGFTGSKLRIRF